MRGFLLFGLYVMLGVAGGALGVQSASAQEQFFTQSGGRGLQNAKTNARLTKAESDIGVIQDDLKTIQPHARAQLGNCANTGEKLRYDGRNWICETETDPTVKGFAKKDLPSCSGGSILGVSGGELSCVESGFVSNETDPTVQPYAKTPLPSCGSEQNLSVVNGALGCQTDQKGLTLEVDPKVHNFARKDIVSALPNCGSNELLTMNGGLLSCKVDSVGITQETDPLVQPFARTDNGQPALAACPAGEVLRAVTQGSAVVLVCEDIAGSVGAGLELDDLSDVNAAGATSGTVLTFNGTQWQALAGLGTSGNPLNLSQLGDVTVSGPATDQLLRWNGTRWANSDDKVGALTDTNWCQVVSGKIVCDRPPPLTCTGNESLRWDGTGNTWVCTDLVSGAVGAIALDALTDVTVTTPSVGQALRYTGTGWANSAIDRILLGDTQIVATDTGTDGLLSFATDGVTRMAITNQGRMGIGVMPSSPYYLDVSGSTRVAGDLTVTGNLNVSGAQVLDGVLFANGGIQMPGTLTSSNVSATNISGTVADIRTLRVTNNQTVGGAQTVTGDASFGGNVNIAGNLNVSGAQVLDGVLFANGGIQMPGTLTSSNVSATSISGTVADIRTLRVTNNQTVAGGVSVTGGLLVDNGTLFVDEINNRVGIGTAAPSWPFELTYSGDNGMLINNPGSGAQSARLQLQGQSSALSFGSTSEGYGGVWNDLGYMVATAGSSGGLRMGTQAAAPIIFQTDSGNTERMRIQPTTGYVGIGTGEPNANLEVNGTISATNLRLSGNLFVSGSQSIDGVVFANGGIQLTGNMTGGNISATNISATGNVSANAFIGDGSGLTGLSLGAITAAGVVGSVQYKGAANEVSGSANYLVTNAASRADVAVSGTLKVAGDGSESCGSVGQYGQMRFVNDSGQMVLQLCRP